MANLSKEKLDDYHRILRELGAVITSDVAELKRVWEANYNDVVSLADGDTAGLYHHLIAHKDFLKAMCLNGSMEDYHAKRVCCLSEAIYREAWRAQVKILAGLFQDTGREELVRKADTIRERVYVCEAERAALDGLAHRWRIRPEGGRYMVEEVPPAASPSSGFDTLPAAEAAMRELVFDALEKSPETFTL